ncbi:hypothetical protein Hanom_Chr10g00896791 [Helianthus anomalus]
MHSDSSLMVITFLCCTLTPFFAPRRAPFAPEHRFYKKKPIFAPKLPPGVVGSPRSRLLRF